MENNSKYIWYAPYGSNLLENRFLCYIQGGNPSGSQKQYSGCNDKSAPQGSEEILICSELYFARNSTSWNNGGVCFIKTEFSKTAQTLGRMYLITKDQFIDVVKQETGIEQGLDIDFEHAISNGYETFRPNSWYGRIVHLGCHRDNLPIFTFTSPQDIAEYNRPDENYLRAIIKGIDETYDQTIQEISDYLLNKPGIRGNFTKEDLLQISESAISQS
jgi:hypothetical protein